MNPFSLFIVLALAGAIVAVGAVVVSECRNAEPVTLPATVADKAVVVRERTETRTVSTGGCPVCPGSGGGGATTVTVIVQEEAYFVVLDVVEGGKVRSERVEVSSALYGKLKAGDKVEYRFLRGKTSGRLCSRPEVLVPAP
ncbi:MAG: hypothetical protein N2320_06005 [Candidatus Bipolaricaulota bacterium]|nr:hypothetical protein [Candidatus Bipolaricaulota bacterium]